MSYKSSCKSKNPKIAACSDKEGIVKYLSKSNLGRAVATDFSTRLGLFFNDFREDSYKDREVHFP